MAQDFYAPFKLGADKRFINASDISGVALAAIQQLHKMVEKRDAEVEQLKRQLADQQAQIQELAAFVKESVH